ncbi:hypothetical protein BGZ79_003642 [Entomortierella chlamydospora]|nr:hypothetical protein BGZ79_003642 [Entomortierella chlamydospora]
MLLETGYGVPCAFFLTKKHTWEVLAGWLRQLKARMDDICEKEYQPTVVITDQGRMEINAIRAIFSYELRIFYCAWHVLQAWERNLTNKNLGMAHISNEEKKRRKDTIREGLRNILYSKKEEQANLQVEAFKAMWEEHAPILMLQQRRIDTVIYILVNKAIPHYQQMNIRHIVQVGRMTPARKNAIVARQMAMEHIDRQRVQDPDATLLSQTLDDTVLQVRSFTNADIIYDTKVDWTRGLAGQFNSCSCPYFSNNKMCCKHIALANLELPYTKFYYKGHWNTGDEGPPPKPLFAEDASLPPINYPSTALTPSDLATHYIQKLSGLMNILDSESRLSNHQEILDSLKRAYELCERHFPVLPEHSLSRKRARQRE